MHSFDYSAPAALYLGSTHHNAEAQGARHFRSAAHALRFAMEEAAPVSLHGAWLEVGGEVVPGSRFGWFYRHPDYPLPHKQDFDRIAA